MKLLRMWYVLTHWEQWHYNIKYVLLAPLWLWYSIKARSFYFFSPANPTLTFGGFEGGPKREIYEHMPPEAYPKTIYIDPHISLIKLTAAMAAGGLHFPVAVKPDVGMMGLMFRKIDNKEELARYHQTMKATYLLQELVLYPVEVSVFYYRFPNRQRGHITGFIKKEALEVVGDGRSTLEQLMQIFTNRPGFDAEEWKSKLRNKLGTVVPRGEVFKLSWVANLSRGARLVSLESEKDEKLMAVFDRLNHASKHLYYGRYDIKCASVADLKEGKNFCVLEFNGSGAEPHHIYGNGNNLMQAFKIINHHWQVLFTIAKFHHSKGVRYPTLKEGLSFTKRSNRHFRELRALDAEMPVFH